MLVTLVGGKIIYGADQATLTGYLTQVDANCKAGKAGAATSAAFSVPSASTKGRMQDVYDRITSGNLSDCVQLTPQQFLRFKMAGRQHGQGTAKTYNDVVADPLTGTKPTSITIQRVARQGASIPLGKWDVARYGDLTGRAGPWGPGSQTNRDHLLAHSSNLIRWKAGDDDYGATSASELKREGLAVVVSGIHHREGSATYGGRAQHVNAAHAMNPQVGVKDEIDTMLGWKAQKTVTLGSKAYTKSGKATLRIEMVGAYFYLYKRLVVQEIIKGDESMDIMLLDYLRSAVGWDDGKWRIDPAVAGKSLHSGTPIISGVPDATGGSKTTRWTVP
ncbi:hypothetical protein [Rhodanobacter thiooxydans]|nr:hypothetical protein [Rhodanobacter thiooxydans]